MDLNAIEASLQSILRRLSIVAYESFDIRRGHDSELDKRRVIVSSHAVIFLWDVRLGSGTPNDRSHIGIGNPPFNSPIC
jgi:hypothetical protein